MDLRLVLKWLSLSRILTCAFHRPVKRSIPFRSIQSSISSNKINLQNNIVLSPEEDDLFNMLKRVVIDKEANGTTVRVAGGWVRDKLLNIPSKNDVDVALDNMNGTDFARALNRWFVKNGKKAVNFGIIQLNPEKSKHLATAAVQIGSISIDFSNLRTENYTDSSRIPVIELGTPQEDAFRRDLTINALFYNINSGEIEDYTGQGIEDLKLGQIRTPLEPLVTLLDDPLRVLRAIRFACRFNFKMVDNLLAACSQPSVHEALKTKVSKERVNIELENMLENKAGARAIATLYKLNLFPVIFQRPDSIADHVFTQDLKSISGDSSSSIQWGVAKSLVVSEICRVFDSKRNDKENNSVYYGAVKDFGSVSRIVRLSALLSFFKNQEIQPNIKKKPVKLAEYILTNSLKMRVKDIETICKLYDSSLYFSQLIDKLEKDEKLTRLELGLGIRKIGELYIYAIIMALGEKIMLSTIHDMKKAATSDAPNTNQHIELIISAIFPGYSDLCNYMDPEAYKSSDQVRSILSRKTEEQMKSFDRIMRVIHDYNIQSAWEITPLFNGNYIKQMFSNIPEDNKIAQIIQSQLEWIISNPAGSKSELNEYLKKIYADYI